MNTVLFKKYFRKVSAEFYVSESVDQNSKYLNFYKKQPCLYSQGKMFTSMLSVVKTWSHLMIRMVLFSAWGYKKLKYFYYIPLLFIKHNSSATKTSSRDLFSLPLLPFQPTLVELYY